MAVPQRSATMTMMVRAAEKAGKALVRDFGELEKLQVTRKGVGDFVTQSDFKSEKILFEELSKARPDYGFLLEEGGKRAGKNPDYEWVIDPIDGTTNFMHGIPFWAISIGLVYKGKPIAGIVFNPISDEMYWAERGQGAYMNAERLRVSGRVNLEDAVIVAHQNFKGKLPVGLSAAEFKKIKTVIANTRIFGSTAMELCYVAAGKLDAYVDRGPKAWDFAAGMLIVQEAGGYVTEINGDKDKLPYADNILAANPKIHAQLLKILNEKEA
jgi:myo-inositol-1(or 4)-monophosphatase